MGNSFGGRMRGINRMAYPYWISPRTIIEFYVVLILVAIILLHYEFEEGSTEWILTLVGVILGGLTVGFLWLYFDFWRSGTSMSMAAANAEANSKSESSAKTGDISNKTDNSNKMGDIIINNPAPAVQAMQAAPTPIFIMPQQYPRYEPEYERPRRRNRRPDDAYGERDPLIGRNQLASDFMPSAPLAPPPAYETAEGESGNR